MFTELPSYWTLMDFSKHEVLKVCLCLCLHMSKHLSDSCIWSTGLQWITANTKKPRQRAPYKEAIIFKRIIPSLIQPNWMFRACTSNHVTIKHQCKQRHQTATEWNSNPLRITEWFLYIHFFLFFLSFLLESAFKSRNASRFCPAAILSCSFHMEKMHYNVTQIRLYSKGRPVVSNQGTLGGLSKLPRGPRGDLNYSKQAKATKNHDIS